MIKMIVRCFDKEKCDIRVLTEMEILKIDESKSELKN